MGLGRSASYIPTVAFAALLAYVTVLQPYDNGPAIRSDGQGYHIWTFALKKWDFRFCEYQDLARTGAGQVPGRCFVKYPPGVALFRFPVMAWFVDVHNHQAFTDKEHWVSLVFGAVLTLATYLLGVNVLRQLRLDAIEAQAAMLLMFFGTGLFHYGTYDGSFSHIYSAFGSAILVWQLARMNAQDALGPLAALLNGAVAFFMVLFRNTNALILFFYVALVLALPARSSNKRHVLVAVCIGGASAAAVQLSYNSYAAGRLSATSYLNESFIWGRPALRAILFSYERGLFTYYPIIGLALALGFARRASRRFTEALLILVLSYATMYAFWHNWFLGGGFGHRGFVELVPWTIPAIGIALADIKSRAARRWILAAGLPAVLVSLQIMLGYWHGSFPFDHAVGSVYWAHVFGGLTAFYFIFAALGLFLVAERSRRLAGRLDE